MTRFRCAAMLFMLALSSCAARRDTSAPATAAGPQAAACAVTVSFGSLATGIDRKAALRAEQLIGAEAGVTAVTRSPAGIEGEYALCVQTASPASAVRLFDRLSKAFAAPVRAPVGVTGPGGSVSAPLAHPSSR